jgi:hypothetical protein
MKNNFIIRVLYSIYEAIFLPLFLISEELAGKRTKPLSKKDWKDRVR